ncbi:flagellar hook assembly protein FlgD [Actimicrobium sp. CCI2.3]|uniref:flagellar hook assembly protein FlgD n=1 Tax=Actimicrobium sp. CCI2.3 TaxID=3048616 RepID=UPI002AB349D4|nr:flagellar hook assembly protein FlgD [Actimicrobium sp. CCI2.3]MDY7575022.1 flagellar hook assembly protein FlgD [Actimicrobium sp. CCI2.3]MEB0021407.1 flagellar hook assembly protein FlgD [Actimicrobium sp. CCI2.3]
MTAITNNVASTSLLATMNPATTAAASASATQDRFMKLLVTQMKNQDPLNPLDNAQVTSQLAQLSTVSGIDKMNTTLESMITSQQSGQAVQAAGMIGHGVLAPGNQLALASNTSIFGVDLAAPAEKVMVTVKDVNGVAVHTMDLGAKDAGTLALTWDGIKDDGSKAADGAYTFSVAASAGSTSVSATALGFGQVSSVSTSATGVKLNVTNLGAIGMTDVRQIL